MSCPTPTNKAKRSQHMMEDRMDPQELDSDLGMARSKDTIYFCNWKTFKNHLHHGVILRAYLESVCGPGLIELFVDHLKACRCFLWEFCHLVRVEIGDPDRYEDPGRAHLDFNERSMRAKTDEGENWQARQDMFSNYGGMASDQSRV